MASTPRRARFFGRTRTATAARLEPSLGAASGGEFYQFERLAYFYCDHKDSRPGAPVFHRTVTLKDAWQKAKKQKQQRG